MTRIIGSDRVEVVLDASAEIGEGPVWDVDRHELLWVDIPRGEVHRWAYGAANDASLGVGQPVGAVALRESGGLVAAVRDGFAFLERDELRLCRSVEAEREDMRMNDGKCDRAGRFWAGTMALDERPGAGSLYRLGRDLEVTRMLDGLGLPNGLAWSLDDQTMYFVDSLAHAVDAFDYDAGSGGIGPRRRVVDIAATDGTPDGMTIDGQGYLWVALWDGWSVRRYSLDGALDAIIELPVAQITSCTLGGPDLDELFITSAAEGLSVQQRERQPHAGAVFRVAVDQPGLPPHRFAG